MAVNEIIKIKYDTKAQNVEQRSNLPSSITVYNPLKISVHIEMRGHIF